MGDVDSVIGKQRIDSGTEESEKLKNEKEKLTDQNNELKEEVKKLKFQLGINRNQSNKNVTLSPTLQPMQSMQPMQLMQSVQYVQTMPQMMVPLTPTNLVFADPNSDGLNFTEQNFQFPTAKVQRLSSGAVDSIFSHIC